MYKYSFTLPPPSIQCRLHLLYILRALETLYNSGPPQPGKPSYSTPKAYHPIALINTTCKLLMAIVADQLTYILEHHNLLPNTHFGGRLGRSTTDSLHLLKNIIKNAWHSHKVASVLFLDIEGAFPNAVTKRLLHNMRTRQIPRAIIEFTEQVLTGRKTQLRFDGYTSD
jgi:hypothetical protein